MCMKYDIGVPLDWNYAVYRVCLDILVFVGTYQ